MKSVTRAHVLKVWPSLDDTILGASGELCGKGLTGRNVSLEVGLWEDLVPAPFSATSSQQSR